MAIPAPLAFAPTAIRNVAAGLVVGNPVGSSGTRAKALTSAELKAIVEASGISYLPLAGGTLTGPITGTGGSIEQRDGLTSQCFDLFETYTSGTNNGKLRFKATSSGHQIGSARAASGSNRALQLGHFNSADNFASAISIATSGGVSLSGGLTCSASGISMPQNGNGYFFSGGGFFICKSSGVFCFSDASDASFGRLQLGGTTSSFPSIKRSAATIAFRLADDSADAAISCAAITASGAITPATLTDAAAPNSSIYYSSTQSKLVYKDSGGAVNVLY